MREGFNSELPFRRAAAMRSSVYAISCVYITPLGARGKELR
jgi:hypothetical protein